jgi:hypothetical protein
MNSTEPQPPAVAPRRAPRWLVGCLVAIGVGVPVLTVVGFIMIWQLLQPSDAVAGQAVAIDGCESAYLFAPRAGDAGRTTSSQSYRLVCRNEKEPPPTCEQTLSRFVVAHGAVPGPVRVQVDYEGHTPLTQCNRLFDATDTAR